MRRFTAAFTSTLGDDVMITAPRLNRSEDVSDIARAPVIEPTLQTVNAALVTAALSWLGA